MTDETNPGWHATGITQEVNPGRQRAAHDRLTELETTATKSQTHLWLVVVSHLASDSILNAYDDPSPDNMPLLDAESMVGQPGVACYVCEAMYDSRLRHRRCPGDPSKPAPPSLRRRH